MVSIFSLQFYLLLEGAHPSEFLTIKRKHLDEESKIAQTPCGTKLVVYCWRNFITAEDMFTSLEIFNPLTFPFQWSHSLPLKKLSYLTTQLWNGRRKRCSKVLFHISGGGIGLAFLPWHDVLRLLLSVWQIGA